jgi:uncharacterized MAPEG superfamily protein
MTSQIALTIELRLLAYSALLCILLWPPYILTAIRTFGLVRMVSYPTPEYVHLPEWARRSYRAHMNMVENIGPFAVLVILAALTGASNELTALGARMFFWSRIGQVALHTAGVPWGRTLTFAVGWAGMIIIFLQIVN